MEEKNDIKPIDFTSIVKKLWPHRKKYYYVLPATLIITYLIIVCIPRYYKCTVRLAPEVSGVNVSGSLSSLASSFGLGGSLAKMNSQDAISSDIYPDVIQSKNFIAELMTVNVETKDGKTKSSYYLYLRDKQKDAWWNKVTDTIKGWFKAAQKDDYTGAEKLDIFGLTKKQSDVFKSAAGKLDCNIDKKTEIVSIEVTDQDPLVCATMANATCEKLQQFIVDYRTNKARIDYEYYQNLCKESEAEYNKAMHRYASFSDSYHKPVLASYSAKETTLEDEMQSSYTLYQGIKAQMQAAQAKLQEATPAFTVIESASVPTKPAGPKRMIISIVMMILSFFMLSAWLLMKSE